MKNLYEKPDAQVITFVTETDLANGTSPVEPIPGDDGTIIS